jgi:putative ABC transport system permease protein
MGEAMGAMGRYLALVGLMAVLLGGVAVASAVHAFIEERLTVVAVLRCLGAPRRTVFLAYLLQTGILGVGGALVGAAGGVAVQAVLPAVLGDFLPVDVGFRVHWPSVLAGLGVGGGVTLLFALLPLLAVREVPPLAAIRRHVEREGSAGGRWRALAYAGVASCILLLSIAQAPSWRAGLVFAVGIGVILAALRGAAGALLWGARRFLPHGAPYPLRQGVSNLFRPRNQTAMVVLALGFGISLLGVLYLVEQSILGRFSFDASAAQPNLLLFDIQRDQRAGVEALFSGRGVALRDVTPIVPARIGAINGRPVAEILADSAGRRVPGWALRREYRNTYRDTVTATERVVAGEWWGKARERERERERERAADRPIGRISMEADLARDLGVGVGDRITWDVQGVPIETVIANVRTVEWARFAPNFFVIFEPGILEEAPQSVVALARVEGAPARAELERELVQRFSNISVLDLARVQETLEGVVGKVNLAVRFLALFSIAGGVVVLAGALTAGRSQRMREGVLLRTLGASRRQVRRILLTEYMALGAMAGAAGLLLAALGSWPLVTRLFKLDYRLPLLPLLAAWGALALLAALIGVLNDRGAGERSPREVLGE